MKASEEKAVVAEGIAEAEETEEMQEEAAEKIPEVADMGETGEAAIAEEAVKEEVPEATEIKENLQKAEIAGAAVITADPETAEKTKTAEKPAAKVLAKKEPDLL